MNKKILAVLTIIIALTLFNGQKEGKKTADSTNPTDYLYSDGIDSSDKGLYGNVGVDGAALSTTGWNILGAGSIYSNVQKTLGSVSMLLNNNNADDNEKAYIPFTDSSYTGVIRFKMYLETLAGGSDKRFEFLGTNQMFGQMGNSNNYFVCKGNSGTIITTKPLIFNTWINISITISNGRMVVSYSDPTMNGWETVCDTTSSLSGVSAIRFMTVGSGTPMKMYIDEFKMTKKGVLTIPEGCGFKCIVDAYLGGGDFQSFIDEANLWVDPTSTPSQCKSNTCGGTFKQKDAYGCDIWEKATAYSEFACKSAPTVQCGYDSNVCSHQIFRGQDKYCCPVIPRCSQDDQWVSWTETVQCGGQV